MSPAFVSNFFTPELPEAMKPLWKEVFRARFPEHLLDCNHYPFLCVLSPHFYLSPLHSMAIKEFNYQQHWLQMFMRSK